MKMLRVFGGCVSVALLVAPLWAQDADSAGSDDSDLWSQEELQELVGPIALYPDTLLIQVLVAATYPVQIIKADAFLDANEGAEPADLEADIATQDWDESVAVLATAFPDVVSDMSDNIEWTEDLGNAMLAQSDDVMDAVQDMRELANEAGTLESNDYQTVEVTQEGDDGDTIIIQPAEPEVVYVPQYDTDAVYYGNNNNVVGDALITGLITWGTFSIMDEIFDNDDPWNDYWGCRNCGGWGGGPIVRDPNIDIDVDGNVNIGNEINGWKPDDKRRDDARDKISDSKRNSDRPNRKGGDKVADRTGGADRGDQLRSGLSERTGAQDISRDRSAANRVAGEVDRSKLDRPQVNRPGGLDQGARDQVAQRTKSASGGAAKSQVKKATSTKAPQRKATSNKGAALQKSGSASRAKAGASRGRAATGGGRSGGGRSGGGRLR